MIRENYTTLKNYWGHEMNSVYEGFEENYNTSNKKNLVFISLGDNSNIDTWINEPNKNYDIWIVYY